MEIEILGHKGRVKFIRGCPPSQFQIWIEIDEAFDNGTIGFGVLIPANPNYTEAEFLKVVTTQGEKDMTASLQRWQTERARLNKEMETAHEVDAMARKVATDFGI